MTVRVKLGIYYLFGLMIIWYVTMRFLVWKAAAKDVYQV